LKPSHLRPDALTRNAPFGDEQKRHLNRSLGLFDSVMIVAGSMIGSGIYIVTGDMARVVGSAGWLMVAWLIATMLTMVAALSYGELAAMMPHAGGQYVYLREAYSPLWGFLYGWTLFLVIQTGTMAASAVGFSRYLGVLWPAVSENRYLISPIHIFPGYAVSLSSTQLMALSIVSLLTWTNSQGIKYGTMIQNIFTSAKIGSLLGVIVLGAFGWKLLVIESNFGSPWTPRGYTLPAPGISLETPFGMLIALCVAQVGSLFAADAWNNITFTAGEVRNPKRNVPLSLALGTGLVMALYIFANLAYVAVLPFHEVQQAPLDRVAAAMLHAIFPGIGSQIMALVIMVAAFGCMNGMILSGGRAYYAMALDGLFFRRAAVLNRANVPGSAMMMQGAWASILITLRTYDPVTGAYGNLYSNLLDYVVSAALIFYILTIVGVYLLRKSRPDADRPYRAIGYPVLPALYIVGAAIILGILFLYRPATTLPGLVIVLLGIPVYIPLRRSADRSRS
jgi:APA family basic amino acid/polyamine antiporter